ncbi:MAG: aminotransferase class I/II-fold pyridoxal phosphate-dependent enzyme [Candidatus Methanoperedens sp.]
MSLCTLRKKWGALLRNGIRCIISWSGISNVLPEIRKNPPFHVMEVLERAIELERAGKSIIHLEIGEPDFPTAPHICEAAFNALKAGETKYTHSLGLPELREAVAQYYNQKFSLEISAAQVVIKSGTSPALLLLFIKGYAPL